MFRCLVEGFAYPSIKRFAAIFGGPLPGGLLCWQSTKSAGAQGDLPVFGVSPCPRPFATMSNHLIHVSGVYLKNLICAIRFHVDILDSVL